MTRQGGFPSAKRAMFATHTVAEKHIYIDSALGNDANPGTAALPFRTIQAAVNAAADLSRHMVFFHLIGTFAAGAMVGPIGSYYLTPWVFQGEDELVDVTGTPVWTATANDRAWLTVAGAGWTPDAWAGRFARISDGAAAGQWAQILSNTADTVYFGKRISTTPGNANFVIGRPKTEVQDSLLFFGPSPDVYVEKLYQSGTGQIYVGSGAHVSLQGFMSATTHSSPLYTQTGAIAVSNFIHDPAGGGGTLNGCGGASFMTAGKTLTIRTSWASMTGLYCRGLSLLGCTILNFDVVRVVGATLIRTCLTAFQLGQKPTGYMGSMFSNSGGVGIDIRGCGAIEFGPIDVSSCGSHGIEVKSSLLHLNGIATGSGNTGAGVYAHAGSTVQIKNGSPPTLTGTVGNLAISDPTLEEETWANIDAGGKVSIAAEATIAEEVA